MNTEQPKYINSGKVRIGTVGQPTKLKDYDDEPLFVGDIVITQTKDLLSPNLTVVCSDEWTSIQTYDYVISSIILINEQKQNGIEHYIMGIRNVNFMSENSKWIVKKVKSFRDVIVGEKWKSFGLNYTND